MAKGVTPERSPTRGKLSGNLDQSQVEDTQQFPHVKAGLKALRDLDIADQEETT